MRQTNSILIVTSEFPPQPGGIGNHAFNLALHLSNIGFDVKVIADQRSEDGKEELQFDKTLNFSIVRVPKYNIRLFMYIKRVLLTIRMYRNAKDIIATGKFSLWNVAFCSLFFKRNSMAVIHGTEVNFKSFFVRKAIDFSLNQFDSIIAVSNFTKSLVKHLAKDVVVIPNGINQSDWDIKLATKKIKGNPVLTTVGRVSSRKGQLNVINHLPELLKYYPDLEYYCVGIPTESEDFKKVAQNLNVFDHVHFTGSLPFNELKKILKSTDIFIMLSEESKSGDVEGFGIAILEANAIGIPAIGSLGCGIEDAIHQNNSGLLINAKDTQQFISAVTNILEDLPKFRSGAILWAESHDWNVIIQKYKTFLS